MTTSAPNQSTPRAIALVLLALLPPLLVTLYVARYKLGMPYWDGWELVPDMQKMLAGQLTWQDLWRTHNEHRILLPRLAMLGLARLTGWDDGYEVAVNLALAAASCLALQAQWRRTAGALGWPRVNALVPLISLIVFALTQWENWVWGWQLVYFLHTFAAVAGLLLLAGWDGRWWRWLGALAFGLAATFSIGMGLLIWPIGLLLVLLQRRPDQPRHWWAAGLWALAGVLVYLIYFTDYLRLPGPGPFQLVLQQPLAYAHYIFNYLGSPALTYDYAYVFGFLGLVAWWGAALWLARRSWTDIRPLLPYLGLGLYAQAGAALVALTRLQFGTHQAIASRYVTLSYPFWISLAVLLYWLGEAHRPVGPAPGWRWLGRLRTWTSLALLGIAFAVAFCSVFGSALGYYWRYLPVQRVRSAALSGAPLDDQLLSTIYPNPAAVRAWLEFLRAQRLSLFHDPNAR